MATKDNTNRRPDYVEHGSEQHALMLGLIPDKGSELGYKLADMTAFGPQATKEFLAEILRQKVTELKAGSPTVPANAPHIWSPD